IMQLFIVGVLCCILALFTIKRTPELHNSFGVLCNWQMYADIFQLVLITAYCLMPTHWAPGPHTLTSIIICQTVETLYFFTGQLHVLMAVHRFVYITVPRWAKTWRRVTSSLIFICTATSIGRILLMTALDSRMYWVYDRETALWFITETPWTFFYEMYLELGWSIGEMVTILILDGITLSRIRSWRAEISPSRIAHRHIETRLVMQSFCQCIPTASITVLYFVVFPNVESQLVQFMCCTFVLSFGNVLDA
ncbi:hypothetical protein PMAYCL1PPCAC_17150, partial [Pristionchus mayeri]